MGLGCTVLKRAYLGLQEPPNEGLLLEEIRKTLDPAKELPVYVRLLDIGADKPLPFMESSGEINPSLGCRGVRFLHKYPDLLQTQLNVLLQLSAEFNLHIIVPMVTLPYDVQKVKEFLTDSATKTVASSAPKLGAMVETPAAALTAPEIGQHVDFLSFGTNDLTQYTFAADRENVSVGAYYDDTNKVIFNLIEKVHDDVPHMPLSICGELAGHPKCVSALLQCGITSLSMAPPSIPAIKEAIRQSN